MQTEIDVTSNRQVGPISTGRLSNSQTEKPKVSIFIISFNQKDFIAEAIESAVSQDYENFEVVISDDRSTDGTAEIIAHWQSRYPERVKALLNKENVGVTRNCNRALRACTGEYITFMGGDDVLLPGKITAQVDWFQQDQSRVLCGHAVEYISADGSHLRYEGIKKLYQGIGPVKYIRRSDVLPGLSIMVRANTIPPHGFDEAIPIASDFLFWIEVLMNGGKFGYVDGFYSKHRVHDNNITKHNYIKILNDFELTFHLVANRYPKYRGICETSIIKHVIYYSGVYYLSIGNKKAAREQFLRTIKKRPHYIKAWLRLLQTL